MTSILQATAIRWTRGASPMLAVVSSASPDVRRWRVEIRDANLQLVYDEVLDTAPRLLVATDRSGHATLLISTWGLASLRPVS